MMPPITIFAALALSLFSAAARPALAGEPTPLANFKSAATSPTNNSRSLTFLAIGVLAAFLIVGLAVEMIAHRRRRRPEESQESPPDFSWLKRP